MISGDTVNGIFEALGSLFTWRNALQLYRDKEVKGVYWPIWGFFAIWGIWNLYYYPSLDQWFSFAGGVLLVLGNLVWFGQASWLAWKKRGARRAKTESVQRRVVSQVGE